MQEGTALSYLRSEMVKCLTVEVTKTLLERGGHMAALSPFISQEEPQRSMHT